MPSVIQVSRLVILTQPSRGISPDSCIRTAIYKVCMFAYGLTPTRTLLGCSDTAQRTTLSTATIETIIIQNNQEQLHESDTPEIDIKADVALSKEVSSRTEPRFLKGVQTVGSLLWKEVHLFILLFSTEPTDRHSSVPKRTHYHGDFLPLALGGTGSGSDPSRVRSSRPSTPKKICAKNWYCNKLGISIWEFWHVQIMFTCINYRELFLN